MFMQDFGGGSLRERDHLEDIGRDGRIILKWVLKKSQYCSRDKIEKNEIDGAFSTYLGRKFVYRVLVGEPEGKSPLGRHRRR